jgi:hypothetical protein
VNTKLLILITTLSLSPFALAGCGIEQAQAETGIEEVEKRIEERMEEIEKRIEKQMGEVEQRIEEVEKHMEKRAAEEKAEEAAQGESANTGEAVLTIEGDPQTKFSGSCAVGDQEGEAIAGQARESFEFELDGQRLTCEIRNETGGDMEVVLEVGNDRSVQSTNVNGATTKLSYSEGAISSSTISSSGSGGQVRSSSSQTQVVVTD